MPITCSHCGSGWTEIQVSTASTTRSVVRLVLRCLSCFGKTILDFVPGDEGCRLVKRTGACPTRGCSV